MVVVIGGSSFIGVYTIDALLKSNVEVVATGRNNKFREYYTAHGVKYIELDLTCKADFAQLPSKNIEGIILLAGLLPANSPVCLNEFENAEDYVAVNTIGTIHVLEYCRANHINRVISTASYVEVFNSWGKANPITEEEPIGFQHSGDHAAYVISKRAAADMMEYYNQQHGMLNAVFRLPPVYGAGPHGSLFINGTRRKSGLQIFIENASSGENIQVFGDKSVSRDIVYVKDVAGAFVNAVQSRNTCGLYNIASGKGVTLQQQAEAVAKVFASEKGQSEIVYRPEIPNHSCSFLFDISKAQKDFNYEPHFSDFYSMMKDYRYELERGVFNSLFQ